MRSILDITIGKPRLEGEVVSLPVGMHVTDDDSDDADMPMLSFLPVTFLYSVETVSKGSDRLREVTDESIAKLCATASFRSAEMITQALHAYIAEDDLSRFVHPKWAVADQGAPRTLQ